MTSPKIEVVRFIDWDEGFRKIEFTKLLRESESHSRLRDAKAATDELLEGKAIEVVVRSDLAASFRARARELGAIGDHP